MCPILNAREYSILYTREMNANAIMTDDFNTPVLSMDRLSRQKCQKKKSELNYSVSQMELTRYI